VVGDDRVPDLGMDKIEIESVVFDLNGTLSMEGK